MIPAHLGILLDRIEGTGKRIRGYAKSAAEECGDYWLSSVLDEADRLNEAVAELRHELKQILDGASL